MYYYIVNPAAGKGTLDGIQDKLKSTLHNLQIDGEFNKTLGKGDAANITKKALEAGAKTIVAVGGDNTVQEIINTVHTQKAEVAVGIIPIGSKNVLANHLGVHNWKQACNVLAVRRLQSYQLMRCGRKLFIYSAVFVPQATEPSAQPSQKLNAKISIDQNLELNCQANELRIYNQKFINANQDNQLLLQIPAKTSRPKHLLRKFLDMFDRGDHPAPLYSQLQAEQLEISFERPATALLDGKASTNQQFQIKLAKQPVQLITARQDGQS